MAFKPSSSTPPLFPDMVGQPLFGGPPSGDPTQAQFAGFTGRGDWRSRLLAPLQTAGQASELTGIQALETSGKLLGLPTDFFKNILRGGQASIEAASPEIRASESAYGQARKSAAEFGPRGGGRTAALAEAPFKEASDVTGMLAKVRPEAAKDLTNISALLSQTGLSALAEGRADIGTMLEYFIQKEEADSYKKQVQASQSSSIGSAIGQAASVLLSGAAA